MYLIIGASSFIGRHIANYCDIRGERYIGTYFSSLPNNNLLYFDLLHDEFSDLLTNAIHWEKRPTEQLVLIICAAITSLDYCKLHRDYSYALNVTSVKRLIADSSVWGAKIVFLSSECVFDGEKGLYDEHDIPNPITEYGKQKLEIEEYIKNNVNYKLILRLSRVVSEKIGEKDIFNEFQEKIKNGKPIVCLKKQTFCATSVNDVAKIIIEACNRNIDGLYHVSSNSYLDRYTLAKKFASTVFGEYDCIEEKDYDELHFVDKRPLLMGLNGKSLQSMLGNSYKSLDDILSSYKKSMEYP